MSVVHKIFIFLFTIPIRNSEFCFTDNGGFSKAGFWNIFLKSFLRLDMYGYPVDLSICGVGITNPVQIWSHKFVDLNLEQECGKLQIHVNEIVQNKQQIYILVSTNYTDFINTFVTVTKSYEEFHLETNYRSWEPITLILWYEVLEHPQWVEDRLELIRGQLGNITGMSLNTDIYLVFFVKGFKLKSCSYVIAEAYGISVVDETVILSMIQGEHPEQRVTFYDLVLKVRRRGNFLKLPLRASSARDPTNFLEAPAPGSPNSLEVIPDGTSTLVFSELQFVLNFTPVYQEGDWLTRYKNDTLKGLTITLFRERKTDLFLGLTSLLPYRAKELNFLQPIYSDGVNGFFIQPDASSLRDLVLQTFPYAIWLCILFIYVLIIGSMIGVRFQLSRLDWKPLAEDNVIGNEIVIWAMGSLCQQGWHIGPKTGSLRIVFIVGYFTGLLCYIAFSAAIVSVLAVQLIPIKSRSDLLKSDLAIYSDNKSSTMAYIVEDLKATTKAKFGVPVSIEGGISKLRTRKPCTFLAFPHYFYLIAANMSLSEQWVCQYLSTLAVTLSPTPHSMFVAKNSPYFDSFNYVLQKRLTSGIHHRFVRSYNDITGTKCLRNENGQPPSISIGDVFSSYIILSLGFIFSSALFVVEKFFLVRNLNLSDASSINSSDISNNTETDFQNNKTLSKWKVPRADKTVKVNKTNLSNMKPDINMFEKSKWPLDLGNGHA